MLFVLAVSSSRIIFFDCTHICILASSKVLMGYSRMKLPEGSPFIMYVLINEFGLTFRQANLIAALLYVGTLTLLIAISLLFLEWRFVAFANQGCAAYCNCTYRMGNLTYIV